MSHVSSTPFHGAVAPQDSESTCECAWAQALSVPLLHHSLTPT